MLHDGYLLLMISPIEDVEHFLFGHYPFNNDRFLFLRCFLTEYLEEGKIVKASNAIIQDYLNRMTGQIRLRNAGRIAALAFPVVLTVSILVGWVYNLTVGNLGEGMMLAGGILFIGEAIAARNGFSVEVKAEDNEAIPEYACRDQGVLKLRSSVARNRSEPGDPPSS